MNPKRHNAALPGHKVDLTGTTVPGPNRFEHGWARGVRTDAERGPGIRTHTGWFYPFTPRADEVDIRDIAHALAMICRFGGHVRSYYSVAQHSVLVSCHVPQKYAIAALLHDAAEAYVGDMVSPIKRQLPAYKKLEAGVERVVMERFELGDFDQDMIGMSHVKEADLVALITEQRDLWAGPARERSKEVWPWARRIAPLGWRAAKYLFLSRWQELTGDRVVMWYDHWLLVPILVARALAVLRGHVVSGGEDGK